MRPPSLRSITKFLALAALFACIRWFPNLGQLPNVFGNPKRNFWGAKIEDAQIPHDVMIRAADRDPEFAINERIRIPDPKKLVPEGRVHHGDEPEGRVRHGDVHNKDHEHLSIPDGFYPISLKPHSNDDHFPVQFCKLNFDKYHHNPSDLAMFKNLVKASSCTGDNIFTRPFAMLKAAPKVTPNGLVFHQSRVGSTLTANLLGTSKDNLMFSESAPLADCILHCPDCTDSRKIECLRTIVNLMGRSHTHSRVFFKLQSIQTTHIDLYVKAFPQTPWIFLFRDPIEIMVSHLGDGTRSSKNAPCLRSKGRGVGEVIAGLSTDVGHVSDAEYCAAHLKMLGTHVLTELRRPESRGIAVDYKTVPDILMDKIYPNHFGFKITPADREAMHQQAAHYSKGMGRLGAHDFKGDNEEKHNMASDEMKRWATSILQPVYDELTVFTKVPDSHDGGANANNDGGANANNQVHAVEQQTEGDAERKRIYEKLISDRIDEDPSNYKGYEEDEREYIPYPVTYPLEKLLTRWPPNSTDIPADLPPSSLEILDFRDPKQKRRAELLRYNEVPFVITHNPMIEKVQKKWTDDYLVHRFGTNKEKITYSETNHFMYFNHKRAQHFDKDYKEPTGMREMTFKEWLEKAKETETARRDEPHYYFQTGSRPPHTWLLDDLYQFKPTKNFFIIDKTGNRGINCRFGAKHIIAEAHYDGGRNFIAMLKGAKRYVILPPSACGDIYLYPKSHPEGRHAEADWSNLNLDKYPKMRQARATEVVLKAGQVLYLPSYWFHYIISLGISAQCNTRSGLAVRGRSSIADCGFY